MDLKSTTRAACQAFTLLAGCALSAYATQLPIQVFQTASGLPRQIRCLVPGRTGVMWICTPEGLVSFDGNGFRILGTGDGLPAQDILDYEPARKGGYWLVTTKGVCRVLQSIGKENPCRLIPIEHPDGDFISNGVLETSTGETWIAMSGGLWRLSAEGQLVRTDVRFPRKSSSSYQDIRCLGESSNGWLLIGAEEGLYAWKAGSPPREITMPSEFVGIWQLLRLSENTILVGMSNGLGRIESDSTGRLPRFEHIEPLGLSNVRGMVRRREGSLWICSLGRVSRIELGPQGKFREVERITEKQGLPSPDLRYLAEDQQGEQVKVWRATRFDR